ncbi:MAG: CoA-binding protein [Deltaproteobacteria bacterium]|nr:CoA-binding protein [Deltaproteobacteria bacterium]
MLDLDYLFHPQSIAIAGVKDVNIKFNPGLMFLEALIKFGYKGRLYPLNLNGGKVLGLKVYKNVQEIPDPVDYIISAIPAKNTPQLVADASAKGVKAIHFFTSGFGEIENIEGEKLQAEILSLARRGGVRIIGPNCLGLYCPQGGLTFNPEVSRESGPVGMISQSGGNASHAIAEGNSRGIHFSKVISMGNGADLNESDYLEYLTHDPETKIITAYLEGIKEGPRFLKALRQELMKLYPSEAGRIFKNPIDMNGLENQEVFLETIRIIEAEDEVDLLIFHVAFDHFGLISGDDKALMTGLFHVLILDLIHKVKKPMAVILHSFVTDRAGKLAKEIHDSLTKVGFAVFLSIPRAARALSKFIRYQNRINSEASAEK